MFLTRHCQRPAKAVLKADSHVRRPAVHDGAGNVVLYGRPGQPHEQFE